MPTQFGTDSIGKPPPKWWRRFERAMLIVFIPTANLMIMNWQFQNQVLVLKLQLIINTGLVALIKGTGMMISNGEEYSSTDITTQVDSQKKQ